MDDETEAEMILNHKNIREKIKELETELKRERLKLKMAEDKLKNNCSHSFKKTRDENKKTIMVCSKCDFPLFREGK